MNRRLSIALLALLTLLAACSDPADPIQQGQLCLPAADDCPDAVSLERTGVGRNTLDYSITHRGDDNSTATLRITTRPQDLGDDLSLPDEREQTDDGLIILYQQDYDLGSDETVHNALGSFDLTVARQLQIELLCDAGPCDHHLAFLFFSESIECVDNDACSRNEFCEIAYGRCAECLTDDQCEGGQSCDRDTGFCAGAQSTGCQSTTAPSWPPVAPLVILAFALGAAMVISRRRRVALALAMGATVCLTPLMEAQAQSNRGASMNAGGGLRILTGDAGDLVYPGWGIKVSHEVHWGDLGFHFQLASHSLRLRDDPSPDGEARPVTGYGISVGPRYHFRTPLEVGAPGPDRPLEILAGIDYTRLSFAENRLASVTGLDLNYHALGPTLGLRWAFGSLELTGLANLSQIFDWPGQLLSVDLTIGLNL